MKTAEIGMTRFSPIFPSSSGTPRTVAAMPGQNLHVGRLVDFDGYRIGAGRLRRFAADLGQPAGEFAPGKRIETADGLLDLRDQRDQAFRHLDGDFDLRVSSNRTIDCFAWTVWKLSTYRAATLPSNGAVSVA